MGVGPGGMGCLAQQVLALLVLLAVADGKSFEGMLPHLQGDATQSDR